MPEVEVVSASSCDGGSESGTRDAEDEKGGTGGRGRGEGFVPFAAVGGDCDVEGGGFEGVIWSTSWPLFEVGGCDENHGGKVGIGKPLCTI